MFGSHGSRGHHGRRSLPVLLAVTAALGLATPTVAVAAVAATAIKPPAPDPGPSVKGVVNAKPHFVTLPNPTARGYSPTQARWPAASSGTASLALPAAGAKAGARGAAVRASGTPVWAQAVAGKSGYGGPRSLGVRMLDHAAAQAAGVTGAVFTVTPAAAAPAVARATVAPDANSAVIRAVSTGASPAAGQAGTGTVQVGLDYKSFAQAYGGNFGSRLSLVKLPACAATTPVVRACQEQTPVATVNDVATGTVSGQVTLAATGRAMVLAATTDPGQEGAPGGNYAATSLKPEGSWSGGDSTGSFTYSYPVTVPPAASSLVPSVDLMYDSSSVDGQTASTSAQASWAGDGWSTGDSFVERSFTSCADNPEGTASPVASTDECYDGPVLTLSLGGKSTSLVCNPDETSCQEASDTGDVVKHVTGSGNGSGTYNTDYWTITERNGTVYSFGRNELPGWSSGKAVTNSVASMPVFSAHSGDPCYKSTGFADSVCTMAYRWNLDYVKDVHGNAMAYYYNDATNFYGEDKGAHDVSYIRDSYLDHVDYGFTDGGAYGTIPDKVAYSTADRCVSGTCDPLNSTTKANWPDVPFDLVCASGATCTQGQYAPSFFSTVRLTTIAAEQWVPASASYATVDSYALDTAHFPATGDGTSPTLWLASISRTGSDTTAGGTSSVTLPPVKFIGMQLPNRVDTVTDGLPPLYRYRIASITTETGSVISPTYYQPNPCTAPVTITPSSNTSSCYPVYWTPQNYDAPFLDWFNSWVVQSVTQTDPTGGAPVARTDYQYLGGAAWHYDDNEVVKAKYRTYGQFRGYADVRTLTGDGTNDPQTETGVTYYRGMSKDNNSTVVNVTDSLGGNHEDLNQLAGKPLEETSYLGANGPADHSAISSYWVSAAAATRTRSGLPDLTANFVAPAETYTRQALTATGSTTWRYTETDTSYDTGTGDANFGLPLRVYTHQSPVAAAYDSCETTSYAAANTSANIVGLTAESETDSVACGGYTAGSPASVPAGLNTLTAPASVSRPSQVMSDTRTFYDDTSYSGAFPQASAPSKGDVTMVQKASGYSGGAFSYQVTEKSAYDSYGRVTASYDGNGNKTATAYTTASGLTTASTVTNPLGQATSTTLDPERGLTLTSTDANGIVTTQQYDALGRVTGVWRYSRAVSLPANYRFTYLVSQTGITAVTTQKLNDEAGYETSVQIYDAMLRVRQTQDDTPAASGGRLVTDTFYDTRGLTEATFNDWWDSGNSPVAALATTINGSTDLAGQAHDEDYYTYDGLGRQVVDNSEDGGKVVSTTTTVYNGDRTTVVPPAGGAVKTTLTDPLGRTSSLQQYTTRPAVNVPANVNTGVFTVTGGAYDTTSYGYDGHGNQATTASGGRTWTSTYNLLGQVTSKADPDSGTSSTLYDANGNALQVTDARGKVISYTYDALDRKTGEYDAALGSQSAANQLASWVYDNSNNVAGVTDAIGQLTTETAYSGGAAYVTQQKGFNVFGEPLGETVTIPSATEGSVLGKAYAFTHTYTTLTGLPFKDGYQAAAGLPAETALHQYGGLLDMPTTLGGLVGYAEGTDYDAWGRVLHEQIGNSAGLADIDNAYDPHTGNLKSQAVSRENTTPSAVDTEGYSYDLAGNVTSQADTHLGAAATSETQCYGYDPLARLTSAWTATDNCATAPTSSDHSMVGDGLGGTSAYWTTWGFDAIGNRTSQVGHAVGSGTDTTTSYGYDGNGKNQPDTLTSATASGGSTATASYGYDAAGNMTSRNAGQGAQTLTWDDTGRLAAVTGSTSGNSGYVYDADGNLLLQKDPGSTTLYLPGEQITLNTSAGTTTGIRYFSLPGGGTAYRTGSGNAYGYEVGDRQGTNLLMLDYTAQVPIWRQQAPYGASRGAAVQWIDNRAFLAKPADAATGLDIVGARQYDPGTGRFASIDPVRATDAPLLLNGYSYTADNPITTSDPTGAMPCDPEGHCGSAKSFEQGGANADRIDKENASQKAAAAYSPNYGNGYNPNHIDYNKAYYCTARAAGACHQGTQPKRQSWFTHTALPWLGHQFSAHWRGLAQIGISAGVILIGTACAATVICGTVVASMAISAAVGGIGGGLSYYVGGGKRTRKGWVMAVVFGAAGNALGTGAGTFFGKAGAAAAVAGASKADVLGWKAFQYGVPMAVGASFGAYQYMLSSIDDGGTPSGVRDSTIQGGLGNTSVDPGWVGLKPYGK